MTEPFDDDHPRERADRELVARLRESGTDPSANGTAALVAALIEYGYGVLRSWIRSGTIHQMAANHGPSGVRGLARIPRQLQLAGEDAHDLTLQIIEMSIPKFLETLHRGQWRPGSASISTYFIGRCLMELPDAFEKWNRQRERWARDCPDDNDHRDRLAIDGPEHAVIVGTQLETTLACLSVHVRAMFELRESGYNTAEIADMFTRAGLPHTPAQVRTLLHRTRKAMQTRRDRDERGEDDER